MTACCHSRTPPGFQIAQVRLIFQLMGLSETHPLYLKPLIYVQWFKYPTRTNPDINMHITSRSLDVEGNRRGEVVELAQVARRIQLIPKFGTRIPADMNTDTIMEMDDYSYFVNSFFDKENYQAVY